MGAFQSYACPICGNRLPRAASRCFFCDHPLPMYKGKPRRGPRPASTAALPPLFVPERDFARLERLARLGLVDSADEAARELLRRELDRAIVRPVEDIPETVVRLGTIVVAQDGDGTNVRRVEGMLIYPGERPAGMPAISVTSMLGAAVLGLSAEDVMPYASPDGARHAVKIVKVFPPPPSGEPPSAA